MSCCSSQWGSHCISCGSSQPFSLSSGSSGPGEDAVIARAGIASIGGELLTRLSSSKPDGLTANGSAWVAFSARWSASNCARWLSNAQTAERPRRPFASTTDFQYRDRESPAACSSLTAQWRCSECSSRRLGHVTPTRCRHLVWARAFGQKLVTCWANLGLERASADASSATKTCAKRGRAGHRGGAQRSGQGQPEAGRARGPQADAEPALS